LRRWFGHVPDRWEEFRRRYRAELDQHPELVARLLEQLQATPLTLLYAARDEVHVVLRDFLATHRDIGSKP